VDASGKYTAPRTLPSPASATLTAQSAADPSKQISAAIAITSSFLLQLAAPSTVPAGATATIVATLTPVPGSNPNPAVSWALSGPGCSGSSFGTLTVVTTQTVGGNSLSDSATYTAPGTAPSPTTVTVTVTPQADSSKSTQAIVAILPGVNVGVSPSTATLAANHRLTLSVQVNGTSNSGIIWNVNGVAGGNTTLGQICVVASNPCQTVTSTSALQVDYLAPGAFVLSGISQRRDARAPAKFAHRHPKSAIHVFGENEARTRHGCGGDDRDLVPIRQMMLSVFRRPLGHLSFSNSSEPFDCTLLTPHFRIRLRRLSTKTNRQETENGSNRNPQ
jgi:hypothetical protein